MSLINTNLNEGMLSWERLKEKKSFSKNLLSFETKKDSFFRRENNFNIQKISQKCLLSKSFFKSQPPVLLCSKIWNKWISLCVSVEVSKEGNSSFFALKNPNTLFKIWLQNQHTNFHNFLRLKFNFLPEIKNKAGSLLCQFLYWKLNELFFTI